MYAMDEVNEQISSISLSLVHATTFRFRKTHSPDDSHANNDCTTILYNVHYSVAGHCVQFRIYLKAVVSGSISEHGRVWNMQPDESVYLLQLTHSPVLVESTTRSIVRRSIGLCVCVYSLQ